jgi:hypothetical protein
MDSRGEARDDCGCAKDLHPLSNSSRTYRRAPHPKDHSAWPSLAVLSYWFVHPCQPSGCCLDQAENVMPLDTNIFLYTCIVIHLDTIPMFVATIIDNDVPVSFA